MSKLPFFLAAFALCVAARGANPYLPLWEYIPDGEPYVFDDPDKPGEKRVYIYGSHDAMRNGRACGREQVVWSASVKDLNRWRFDGVIFRSIYGADGQPLNGDCLGDVLYAPDVAETVDAGGRKTYWLYPNTQARGRNSMVAKSNRPDGPFEVSNWDASDPKKTVGCMGFDPAVLVDDDGRVYGYWGYSRSFAAELDPATMATVKPGTKIVEDMIESFKKENGNDARFFEASSIRKIKDKYVFIYDRWTKDGEFGLATSKYNLAYAYSDKPLGPWTYGGTIIDARGRETLPDGTVRVTATPDGNTHGSICEINGRWYVFFHRQSGTDIYGRQAMVAPIEVAVEEGPGGKVTIGEAEYTSEGFETGGLDPFARHAAGIASVYYGERPAERRHAEFVYPGPYMKPCYADLYAQRDPYAAEYNRCPVAHCTAGSVLGYKYFDFSKTHGRKGLELEVSLVPHGVDAKVEVWVGRPCADEGGAKIGEFALEKDWPDAMRRVVVGVAPLADRNAREALYFVFSANQRNQSLCEIEDFRFRVARTSPAGNAETETVRDLPFPLADVRLTGGPLQAQQEQNRRYLLRLEPDRLLSRFRSEAGLKPKAEPYGGWENPVLKRDKWIALPGHILAFWMSGAAMTVEATGDAELKKRLLYVVDELEAVQDAHGCGYALATKNGRKAYAEIARGDIRLPDRVVNGRRTNFGSVNGVFDLVYVLNKMLIGLCRTHEATGSEKALRVFLRMSDWFGEEVVDKLDDAQVQKLLLGEHGSLPETYVWAWRRTGEEKYLRWARRLCHRKLLDPIIAGDADFLVGQHCNANIPKLFAALRVGDATGEPQFRKAARDGWRKFALEHTVACGGNGCDECLFPASDFEKHLPHLAGAESCGSANMLRLTETLFEDEPSAEMIDYYERVLFDHLLSTHDPILGRTVYHTPMRHATTRTYSSEFNSMWCCTGSGLETPAKYGWMVFTRASNDSFVRVNLFAPATLDWNARGVKLRQETAFPYAETSCLKVEAVGANPEFAVKVRRPAWAGSGFAVCVNGKRIEAAADGEGYVSVKRSWNVGDRIDIEFPMSLRAEYLPGSKNYAAFFYGPVLLVGDDGSEGILKQQYVSDPVACEGVERSYCSSSTFESRKAMPSIPQSAVENPDGCLERTACSPLTFRMAGTDMLLKPLFALHFSRYTTYWRVMSADEDRDFAVAEAKAAEYARRAVDGVSPADYWSERRHSLAGSHSESGVNIYGGPKSFGWRGAHGASGDAFFSYRLAVGAEPGGRTLVARYRNCEKGARTFDVQVDGKTVFTESLKDGGRRGFIFREMPIPQELLAGKKEVEVRFVPKSGNIAGGLFGLWLVTSDVSVR